MSIIEKRKRITTATKKEKELQVRELEIVCLEMQLLREKEKLQNFTNMLKNRLYRVLEYTKKNKKDKVIKELYKLQNALNSARKEEKINGICEYAKIARYMYQFPNSTFDEAKLVVGVHFGGDLSREDFYIGLKEKIEKIKEKHLQHYTPQQ